jgi:hypothetical protein
MPFLAVNFGALLIALGLLAFFAPGVLVKDSVPYAKTALIPAGIGLLIEICGMVSLSKPGLRKHMMHFAALLGTLGFIGGLANIFRAGFDFNKASTIVSLIMALVCLIFVGLCVRSFIAAKKARQAAAASAAK